MAWDIALFRQFYRYLQRQPGGNRIQEPRWPRFSRRSTFAPHPLSPADIRCLLRLASGLERPRFRSTLYRALLLVLYCTGVRFGEALRLRVKDVDVSSGLLFIAESKGCSRWVPFHRSLARELDQYLAVRRAFAPARPDARLFVGVNRRTLPVSTAHRTICKLFRQAGMKPAKGRVGPRPYDLRHAFANHRLTRWYRQGVDLHARLPWLSAYMGHGDISGTETYLNANPELLALAGDRFRRHCLSTNRGHR
jgi:site-specific recombinase XerD